MEKSLTTYKKDYRAWMSKTKETLSFYYKTQTRITKGTRKWLDLEKSMVDGGGSCGGRSKKKGGRKDEMRFLLVFLFYKMRKKY